MIALTFRQFVDPTFLVMLSERGRRRVFKEAMIAAMQYWHKNILPRHFRQGNISLYPGYFKEKYHGGIPLVDTGEFRDRMLADKKILATYKGARIKYEFGRPERANNYLSEYAKEMRKDIKAMSEKYKKKIFASMRGKKITFEQARNQHIFSTYKRTTYSSKMRVRMAEGVSAFNQADRDEIRSFVQKFIMDNYKTIGKANYKRVKV